MPLGLTDSCDIYVNFAAGVFDAPDVSGTEFDRKVCNQSKCALSFSSKQ